MHNNTVATLNMAQKTIECFAITFQIPIKHTFTGMYTHTVKIAFATTLFS